MGTGQLLRNMWPPVPPAPPVGAVGSLDHSSAAERDPVLHELVERLTELASTLRQSTADALWATLPTWVDEYAYNPNLQVGTALKIGPDGATGKTGQVEKITAIVAYVPASATGLIQLGDRYLPIPTGITSLNGLSIILTPSDVRQLTIASQAGAAALWLQGQVAPGYSQIGNQ